MTPPELISVSYTHLLAVKANALGFIDTPMLKAEALRWHKFQADIESVFLRPGESNLKWQ